MSRRVPAVGRLRRGRIGTRAALALACALSWAPPAVAAGAEAGADDRPRGAKYLYEEGFVSVVTGVEERAPEPRPRERREPEGPDSSAAEPIDRTPEPEQPPVVAAHGIRHWIELLPAAGPGQWVTEERVFRSGERIRLHFTTNVPGYITLLAVGSSGREQVLFPRPDQGLADPRLEPGAPRILPAENAWIRFDETRGEEILRVFFVPEAPAPEEAPLAPSSPAAEDRLRLAATQRPEYTPSGFDRARGSKDVVLEIDDSGSHETGVYRVRPATGEPIAYEIVLRHE